MSLNLDILKKVVPVGIILILVGLIPLFADDFQLTIAIYIGINIIVVLGLSLLMGYAGQISLGHAGLYGLGAYTAAILSTRFNLAPILTLVAAALVAGLFAYVIGLPALRLKGHYLAMATLGAGIIIQILFVELAPLTGGPDGISGIASFSIGPLVFDESGKYFYLVYFFVLLILALSLNIVNSQKGRVLRALHENETAASCLGVNVERHKLVVFALSGVFAGIAGSLYAHYVSFISPETFGLGYSILVVIMVVVGGAGNIYAAFLGAIFLTILSEYFREYQDYSMLLFGLCLVLILIFAPRGLFIELSDLVKRMVKRVGLIKS